MSNKNAYGPVEVNEVDIHKIELAKQFETFTYQFSTNFMASQQDRAEKFTDLIGSCGADISTAITIRVRKFIENLSDEDIKLMMLANARSE